MGFVQSLPPREQEKLRDTWEKVLARTMEQYDLTLVPKLRYAIMSAYLQAIYDGIVTKELDEMKSRITRLY